jgi:hypothetical protein
LFNRTIGFLHDFINYLGIEISPAVQEWFLT